MKRARAVLNGVLHPPQWVRLLLAPIVFVALMDVLIREKDGAPAYMLYGMSAYCLTIWVVQLPRLFRKAKASILTRLTATAFGRKYVEDLAFRGSVSICQSMAVNFLFVVFRFFVGIRYASIWFLTMAMYDLLLGIIRLSLILSWRGRTMYSALRCFRRTAWLLLLLNIPMGGMITLMVTTDSCYSYPGYVIYLSAMYTFYTIILSVVHLVRCRRLGSPILSASKVLNFAAALMSLLGLQTAMISRFSTRGEDFRRGMNAVTGGGVWLAVILLAVYMLHRSRKMREGKAFESLGA